MGGSPGDVGEVHMTYVKQRKGCSVSCDVGKATEGLENQLLRRWSDIRIGEWGGALPLLHLRHRHFTYVTAHSSTLPPLYLVHSSFYNPSVASPTSQALHLRHSSFFNPSAASFTPHVILQPLRCFTYVTGTSRTSPGELPMHRGMKKQLWWTSLLQRVTKFRSSYSFE